VAWRGFATPPDGQRRRPFPWCWSVARSGVESSDFEYLVAEGYVAPADLDLFICVDEAEEIIAAQERFYAGRMPEGASS
jgi:predicted Rossmann-fold nucleotide-binding protein